MKGLLLTVFLFCLIPVYAGALVPPEGAVPSDDDGDGNPDRWECLIDQGGTATYMDTQGDGSVDYVLEYDQDGFKSYEALDYNKDGELDDFYFYRRDVLIRREVDSNYDGDVDIWIAITEGVYISGYERDTDFDGQVDLKKKFGEQ